MERKTCEKTNVEEFSFAHPRHSNPFETTVHYFEAGEAHCARAAGHKGQCLVQHGNYICYFEGAA